MMTFKEEEAEKHRLFHQNIQLSKDNQRRHNRNANGFSNTMEKDLIKERKHKY